MTDTVPAKLEDFRAHSKELLEGVAVIPLESHEDSRGEFTEIFRQYWTPENTPCQWNMVRSKPGVLRGVHVHRRHHDYLILAAGRCLFGLFDCRPESTTAYQSAMIEADEQNLYALAIPPGVAHGFYFFEDSMHIYAVSHYWDTDDELGCRFDDPDLKLSWPKTSSLTICNSPSTW